MLAAKIEFFAIAFGVESGGCIHGHSTDRIFGFGFRRIHNAVFFVFVITAFPTSGELSSEDSVRVVVIARDEQGFACLTLRPWCLLFNGVKPHHWSISDRLFVNEAYV